MESGKPTLHLLSQLIHSLVSQLQRAAPLVNVQRVLLARGQLHPQNLALFGGGVWGWQLLASETLPDFCKNVLRKVLDFLFVCLFVLLFGKALVILQFEEKGKEKLSLEF